MKIIAVHPFYLKMPQITDAADGTQDTLLVRIRTDEGIEGWGECDASPLVSLAVYCCPMSHGNIINIRESLIGETLDGPDDVLRLHTKVLRNGLDIQQIHHAYSGADIALWDIIGKKLGQPIYRPLPFQSPSEKVQGHIAWQKISSYKGEERMSTAHAQEGVGWLTGKTRHGLMK